MNNRPEGGRAFALVWIGQVVSMMGSSLSRFALVIWVWERTGEATPLVLVGFFGLLPSLLFGWLAGPLVDRWNRQRVMAVADLAAGLTTFALLFLLAADQLEVWHLYVVTFIASSAGLFQFLAYSAAITMLLPKEQYARASGLITLAEYASKVAAPPLAGVLIGVIGLGGILLIDVFTFLFAVGALLLVRIPQPEANPEADEAPRGFRADAMYGFRFIFARPGLLGLVVILVIFSTTESLGYPLIAPMLLARSGGDEVLLGGIQGVLGIGGVVGGLLISVWGGPKRKIHVLLIGLLLTGLLGDVIMGLGRSVTAWIVAAICLEIFIPALLASHQAIWQTKVPAAAQGRVFAARSLLWSAGDAVAFLLTGVLADQIFEPAMLPDGALAGSLGGMFGVGPGAGMAVMISISGLLCATAGIIGYVWRPVRRVELDLPDQN